MATLLTMVAALALAAGLQWLRVPAGALIGAMVAVGALSAAGVEPVRVPEPVRFLAFVVIGWLIGQQFGRDTVAVLRGALLPVLITVVVLLGTGALVALVLRALGVDPTTAFLAASPGAISQMAAFSTDVGADGPLVTTVHLARVVAVILVAPLAVKLLS